MSISMTYNRGLSVYLLLVLNSSANKYRGSRLFLFWFDQ
ncbi:hypothetical protein IFVP177_C150004 [Vibrio parahaemolyticus]